MELVVVERTLEKPMTPEQLGSRTASCYELRNVKFLYTLLSRDGRRCICVYEAPDAASVRAASEENGDPYERIWTSSKVERNAERAE